jgi:hypothetical protein
MGCETNVLIGHSKPFIYKDLQAFINTCDLRPENELPTHLLYNRFFAETKLFLFLIKSVLAIFLITFLTVTA